MGSVVLYNKIKSRLVNGDWKPGQRLPSVRYLVKNEGISHHFVLQVYDRLYAEGYIEAQQGRGYFVTRTDDSPTSNLDYQIAQDFELSMGPLFRILQGDIHDLKLGCGWLPVSWRDTDNLARSIRRTARTEHRALVEYGDIQGYRPLREKLCHLLNNKIGIDISPVQLITTLGATQALDLITRLLIKPGDIVLVDEPGNGNLIRLIDMMGGKVIGVPRGPNGPDTKEIKSIVEKHNIKAFYCNSTFHNPTGGNLSARVAFDVLRIAIEHDFMIVEDDVYGDFATGEHQSFAELDGLDRVIYIGSFSKSLSSSLRIGYLACSVNFIAPLLEMKLLTSVAVPGFCEHFVNQILSDGSYLKHMFNIRRNLQEKQGIAQKKLSELGWKFNIKPSGGMFLWIYHPVLTDTSGFIEKLSKQNVLLMPGSSFSVDQKETCYLRINVSHFTIENASFFDVSDF